MGIKLPRLLAPLVLLLAPVQAEVIAKFTVEKEESAAVLFGRLQDMRKEKNPDCGTIFITPEVAKRKSYRSLSLKNLDEIRVMQFICKVVNAGFHEDDFGNYYVVTPGETFNRLKEGQWIPYPKKDELSPNIK